MYEGIASIDEIIYYTAMLGMPNCEVSALTSHHLAELHVDTFKRCTVLPSALNVTICPWTRHGCSLFFHAH
jgi:hypothetical protein